MNENLEQEMTVEAAFSKLDTLVTELEAGGKSLEETFSAYQEGLKLVKFCNEKIDTIEKKLQILENDGGRL